MPEPITIFTPIQALKAATRAVPAVKFAVGLLGLAAAISLIRGFLPDVGIIGMLPLLGSFIILMAVLVILSAATASPTRGPVAQVFLWATCLFVIAFMLFTVTAVAFGWPSAWARIILPAQAVSAPLIPIGGGGSGGQEDDDTKRPNDDPAPVDEAQRRIAFVVSQLERVCLSNLSVREKRSVSASLRASILSSDKQVASQRAAEVARGASRALPAELQVSEGNAVRQCISDNFDRFIAAVQPVAQAPSPLGPKAVRPNWTSVNDDWPHSPSAKSDFIRVRETVLRECGKCMVPKDESTLAPSGVSNSTGSRIAIDARQCKVGVRLALSADKIMQASNAPMAITQRYARVDIEPGRITHIFVDDVVNAQISPIACLSE